MVLLVCLLHIVRKVIEVTASPLESGIVAKALSKYLFVAFNSNKGNIKEL